MKIVLRDITSVQPYDRNPRVNDQAIDAVAASLREFGFRQYSFLIQMAEWQQDSSSFIHPADTDSGEVSLSLAGDFQNAQNGNAP